MSIADQKAVTIEATGAHHYPSMGGVRAAEAWKRASTDAGGPDSSELPDFNVWNIDAVRSAGGWLDRHTDADVHEVGELSDEIDIDIEYDLEDRNLREPFTFAQQCDGDRVQNLIPRQGMELQNGNSGRVALGWHSDDSVLEESYRADNLVLVGVDNPHRVPTQLVPVKEIVRHLDAADVKSLSEPRYEFPCPESFALDGARDYTVRGEVVLREASDGWHIRFATYSTKPVPGDRKGELALRALTHAIANTEPVEIVLLPGSAVTFSNSKYLHSRGSVTGRRWIKRVYLKRDLSAIRAAAQLPKGWLFDLEVILEASLASRSYNVSLDPRIGSGQTSRSA